ncbi:MAG TPA: CpsD/CapB family tyrosine-protein kinase, partial [Anaerovoracaceae bacterium]|nr:CpsD/CapB family tyrosine-protein kinase [Anaerovoracaceae bacterium]
ISDLLAGLCESGEALRDTDLPGLKVICAGTIPPNPGELLGSEDMEAWLSQLEKDFDYILFDTPPVNMVSDALVLSKLCDGVVVVTRQKQTLHPELTKALSRLAFVEAKVLGLILNDVAPEKGYGLYKYGKYKKKYYEYEYGYGYSNQTLSE